jgi:hypothetical protein
MSAISKKRSLSVRGGELLARHDKPLFRKGSQRTLQQSQGGHMVQCTEVGKISLDHRNFPDGLERRFGSFHA